MMNIVFGPFVFFLALVQLPPQTCQIVFSMQLPLQVLNDHQVLQRGTLTGYQRPTRLTENTLEITRTGQILRVIMKYDPE